jgi:hypothetical protein
MREMNCNDEIESIKTRTSFLRNPFQASGQRRGALAVDAWSRLGEITRPKVKV